MPSPMRLQRIADRIQQDLSELLLFKIQDPRLAGITITDVKVDRELSYTSIYVSAIEGQERAKEVLAGLESAKGFLRRELAQRAQLRAFPQLRFYWDPTPEHADHIEKLLDQIRDETYKSNETNDEQE
ncbi:MAG: 30S ribosome-binding factor RbfA [Anaerolineaceae bacterium]|nr:30S ribosome-binding factor RbfA [Anaerolineaceae bacterium]